VSSPVRSWIAVGVLAFVGNAAVRSAVAQTAAGEPTVTPSSGNGAVPAPPYPAAPHGGYAPPGSRQPQLTKVHRPRRGLVIAGAITFGVSWGVAAAGSFGFATSGCSSSECSEIADYLWLPIVGPTVVAATEAGDEGADGIFYLWTAAQAAGVVMLVIGLIGHDVPEYRVARRGPTLQLAPLFARDANGMALTARW
jgi:hypothetical protein